MIIHTVIKSLNLLGPNYIVAPTPCKPAREGKAFKFRGNNFKFQPCARTRSKFEIL
jgi:hypothetical protein